MANLQSAVMPAVLPAAQKAPMSNEDKAGAAATKDAGTAANSELEGIVEGDETVTGFSQLLSQASVAERQSSLGFPVIPIVQAGPEILVPDTSGDTAYELLPVDGNELPFMGQNLPQGMPIGSAPEKSQEQLSVMPNKVTARDSRLSAIKDEIALWLQDPELAFVAPPVQAEKPINAFVSGGLESQASPSTGLGSEESVKGLRNPVALEGQQGVAQSLVNSKSDVATSGPMQLFDQLKFEQHERTLERRTGHLARIGFSKLDSFSVIGSGEQTDSFQMAALNKATSSASLLNSNVTATEISISVGSTGDSASTTNQQGVTTALQQWKNDQQSQINAESASAVSTKAGFARVGVPFNHNGWSENLGKQLTMLVGKNLDSAQIQLDPPELGSLQVKIQVHNDQVSLQFSAAHATVREALESSAARLQDLFTSEGLELADMDVTEQKSFGDSSADQDNDKDAQRLNNDHKNNGAEGLVSDNNLTLSHSAMISDGKIDYFI